MSLKEILKSKKANPKLKELLQLHRQEAKMVESFSTDLEESPLSPRYEYPSRKDTIFRTILPTRIST